MKSTITFSKEDEDLLLATMKFTFAVTKGPALRKLLAPMGYRLHPMDTVKLTVSEFVTMAGQSNTSFQNEFTIQRTYEIRQNYDDNEPLAKAHAEKYYLRVMEELKKIP